MKRALVTVLIVCGAVWWSIPIVAAVTVYGAMSVDLPDGFFGSPTGCVLFGLYVLLISVHGWMLWRISAGALRHAEESASNARHLRSLLLKLLGCMASFGFPATALVLFAPVLWRILHHGR